MNWTAATVITQAIAIFLLPCIAVVLFVGIRDAILQGVD